MSRKSQSFTIGRECWIFIHPVGARERQLALFSSFHREQIYAVLVLDCQPPTIRTPREAVPDVCLHLSDLLFRPADHWNEEHAALALIGNADESDKSAIR